MEIPIRADITNLKGDLSKAVSVVSDASNQFAQAADKASARAKGGVDAILASGNSLKQQYRALSREAIDLANKYGAMDDRAIRAAQAAGEIKDSIEDTNTVINAFKADSKFTVVAGALQQAAGAASIVTGAMGLLGVESESTQKMLLKVQSALALTQGLAQLKEMKASFVGLGAVLETSVLKGLNTFKAALLATGIGAFGILLTSLVSNWDKVKEAVGLATIGQSKYADEVRRTTKHTNEALKAFELEEARLKSIGVAEDRIIKLRMEKRKQAMDATKQELNLQKQVLEETISQFSKAQKEAATGGPMGLVYNLLFGSDVKDIEGAYNQLKGVKEALNTLQKEQYNDTAQLRELDKRATEEAIANAKKLADEKKKSDAEWQKEFNHRVKLQTAFEASIEKMNQAAMDADLERVKQLGRETENEIGTGLKPIEMKVLLDLVALQEAKEKMDDFLKELGQLAINTLGTFGLQASYAFGESLAGGGNWGDSMKQNLASLMATIAAALMALGTAIVTVNPVQGGTLIAGAIALSIAAGALAASARSGANSSTQTQPAAYNPNIGFGGDGVGGNNFDRFSMRTEGRDLILALQRQGSYNRRG